MSFAENLNHIPFTYTVITDAPKGCSKYKIQPKSDFTVYYKGWGATRKHFLKFHCDEQTQRQYLAAHPSRDDVILNRRFLSINTYAV